MPCADKMISLIRGEETHLPIIGSTKGSKIEAKIHICVINRGQRDTRKLMNKNKIFP